MHKYVKGLVYQKEPYKPSIPGFQVNTMQKVVKIQEFYQNLPQLLNLIFPYKAEDNGIFGSFEQFKKDKHKKFTHIQTQWSEILHNLAELFEPHFNNMTSLCMQPQKTFSKSPQHIMSIHDILPLHSIRLIKSREFNELSSLYNNLSASPEDQKKAFLNEEIALDSMELLVMTIMKQIMDNNQTLQPFFSTIISEKARKYYSSQIGQAQVETRVDISRMYVIILTKLINYLLTKRSQQLQSTSDKHNFQMSQCDMIILAFEEYLLIPIIEQNDNEIAHYSLRRFVQQDQTLFKTQHLESIYVLITLLQNPAYLFQNTLTRTPFMNRQFIRDQHINYLMELKTPLYKYFKSAFQLSSYSQPSAQVMGPLRPNRLTDIGRVWLQMLKPWQPQTDFVEAAIRLNLPDQNNQGSFDLFVSHDQINMDMFSFLSHISISAQRDEVNLTAVEDEQEREQSRHLWEQYVREMGIFYFDLLVEYLVALSKCGNFSVDDVIFYNDVLELFMPVPQIVNAERGEQGDSVEADKYYMIDGLLSVEHFTDLVQSSYQSEDFRLQSQDQYFMKAFIDDDFWKLLDKSNSKLQQFNYEPTLLEIMNKKEVADVMKSVDSQIHDNSVMIATIQQKIHQSKNILGEGENQYRAVSSDNLRKTMDRTIQGHQIQFSRLFKGAPNRDWKQASVNKTMTSKKPRNMFEDMKMGGKNLTFEDDEQQKKYMNAGASPLFNIQEEPLQQKDRSQLGKKYTSPEAQKRQSLLDPPTSTVYDQRTSVMRRNIINPTEEYQSPSDQRSSKGKSLQPKQREVLRKSRLHGMDDDFRGNRGKMRGLENLYEGNHWNKTLGQDEWWILYYISRFLAFKIDKLRGVEHDNGQPQCQWIRYFANKYNVLKVLIWSIVTYYILILLIL